MYIKSRGFIVIDVNTALIFLLTNKHKYIFLKKNMYIKDWKLDEFVILNFTKLRFIDTNCYTKLIVYI